MIPAFRILDHCHVVAGDPVATMVKQGSGDPSFTGKLDTYVVGYPVGQNCNPGPTMVVRRNWNATPNRNDFGTGRSVGVAAEALGGWSGMRATITADASGQANMRIANGQLSVAVDVPMGFAAPAEPVVIDNLHTVAWQKSLDGPEGYLTINGNQTLRMQDGKLEPISPTGTEWWARDQRAFLRQDR